MQAPSIHSLSLSSKREKKIMIKQKNVNRWLWKWHVIGGLISLPFLFLLSITGAIYLFKADFNNIIYDDIKMVKPPANNTAKPYAEQLAAVQAETDHHVTQVYLADSLEQATGFRVHGKGHK